MKEIEADAWDMKFQNFWGHAIAAAGNAEMEQAAFERLLEHVGNFRGQTAEHFRTIVDNLHLPDFGGHPDIHPVWYSLEDAALFDEFDHRSYLPQADIEESDSIFIHNNIYYKITFLNEFLILRDNADQ